MKRNEKEEHVSEDETKKSIEEIQKITDSYIKKVDETVTHKEEEIMEV
jgi:ribosome recycling factor